MMGVYPPGSVVQLTDGRFALVDGVNSVRPLKPRVLVHDPSGARNEALLLDLENEPALGIRRSLRVAVVARGAGRADAVAVRRLVLRSRRRHARSR